MDVSLAFRDTCFNMIAPKWYYYSHFLIDGMPYTANGQHIIGEINPKDADGNQPGNTLKAPVEGSVFTIDTKRDGYAYVWGVFSTSKAYSVFENGKAVGYRLSMIKEGNLASGNVSDLGDNRIDIMFGQHNKPFTKAIPSPSMVITGETAKVNLYGEGVMMFPVKANNSYLVFGNGSNLIFGGVHYNENGQSVIAVGNSLEASEVLLDGITEPSITYTEPKGQQSLGITTLPSMIYGDAAYTLPTTTIEGLNLTWSINNSSVATITDQILTIVGAGTATVTATQAGDDSYLPFTREFALTVNKTALTITAKDCTRNYREDNPELGVNYDGFKYNDDITSLKKQPTVTTTATKISPVGEYPITASGAEADNYTISYVAGKLTILKVEQTLSLTALPAMTYGDAAYTLPAKTTEGLALTWTSSNTAVASISSGKVTIKGAGTAKIIATQAGNDSYLPFSREFTLTVAKATLTITADNKEKQQGEDNPVLTVSYAGFKYNDNASSLTKQPTVTTTATVNSPAGTYPITVSGAESNNYSISYVQGTLTVTAAPVNTTVLSPSDITGREDEEVELPITLDNAEFGENVVGVSFTLQLPEGVSVALDEDDDPVWSFVSERVNKKQFNVTPAQYADGTWGFRVYTTSASGVIKGTSGAFMTLTLKVAEGVEDGEYTIKLKDNKLSVKDATNNVSSVTLADATSTLTIENYVLGDVNADGEIDLSDAIMVTYYSLHIVPSGFILKAADMNADGEVDLSDAIIIIYKSLGVIQSRSAEADNRGWTYNNDMQLTATGNGYALSMANEGAYLGLQCDVRLPEGMMLDDVRLDDSRSNGHTVMWNQLEDGSYRIVVFSLSGKAFKGNVGELLSRETKGTTAGNVTVEHIFLVGCDLQKYVMSDLSTQTTGIYETEKGIGKSEESTYDLQGRKVTTPRKGLYLKGNNKYLVK